MLNLEGLKNKENQELCFMHGYCDYLALAVADKYDCKIAIWLDFDYIMDMEVLVHTFVVVKDGLYFDAEGFFTNLSERDYFEYNHEPELIIKNRDVGRNILEAVVKIDYAKKEINDFLEDRLKGFDLYKEAGLWAQEKSKEL